MTLLVFYCLFFVGVYAGNRRYFVTKFCGEVLGPDYGIYLEYDKDALVDWKNKDISIPEYLKGSLFRCVIVLRGMPSTGEKRFMSIHFRLFTMKERSKQHIHNDPQKCGKAYMTIYRGKDTTADQKYTLCGGSALPSFYEFPRTDYITLKFHVDYRHGNITPSSSTPTDTKNSDAQTNMYPYPKVFFKIDITSFTFACNETVPGVTLKCNDSLRCLDDSLRCDVWGSKNCLTSVFPHDVSDNTRLPPGNCFKETTTTSTTTTFLPPTPDPPLDLRPVYVSLGIVLLVVFVAWCCWKPGYLPWRTARFRNVPYCRACLACNNRFCVTSVTCCPCCHSSCCIAGYASDPAGHLSWKFGGTSGQRFSVTSINESDICASVENGKSSNSVPIKRTASNKVLPLMQPATSVRSEINNKSPETCSDDAGGYILHRKEGEFNI